MKTMVPAERTLLVPSDCLSAIWGTVNGRCLLYFNVLPADSFKLLNLFVECHRAERDRTDEAAADDEGRWEWG